jgi:transcriptional regulator with XRE-family HTH domain
MTIYERIRDLRIQYGMSQDDLAKAVGYKDRSMITKIEAGKVDISQKKILDFARVLNTTTGYLMGLSEDVADTNSDYPHTTEARILAKGIDKLPQEQREQALSVIRAMFAKYADYFEKETNDHDA